MNTANRLIFSFMILSSLTILGSCETTENGSGLTEELKENPALQDEGEKNADPVIVKEADVMPEPEQGLQDFLTYVTTNINYPEKARENNIEGKVFVEFTVDARGNLINVMTKKGLGYGLDEEAEKVIANYDKKWKPGIKDGKSVNVKMVLPVIFAL